MAGEVQRAHLGWRWWVPEKGRNSWEGRERGVMNVWGRRRACSGAEQGGGVATGKPHLQPTGDDFIFSIFLSKGEHEQRTKASRS